MVYHCHKSFPKPMKMNTRTLYLGLCFALSLLFSSQLNSANYYWVGNGGSWEDYATHWATTSGGSTFHTQQPGPGDDVFFDANSFSTSGQIVTLDEGSYYCHSMDWTGVTNMPSFGDYSNIDNFLDGTTVRVYGSFILASAMEWGFNGFISFESASTGNIIDTDNLAHLNNTYFNSSTGGWELASGYKCQNIYLLNGTLETHGQELRALYEIHAVTSNPFTLLLDTTHMSAGAYIRVTSSALTIDADSATLTCGELYSQDGVQYKKVIISSVSSTLSIYGNTLAIGEVYVSPDAQVFDMVGHSSTITRFTSYAPTLLGQNCTYGSAAFYRDVTTYDDMTFDTLRLNNPSYQCIFRDGKTITVNHVMSTPSAPCAGGFTTMRSMSAGTQATISKASGTVTCYNLSLQDINATGGATFIANSSIVVSNVTGWTVNAPAPRTLYWVGGAGNWSDPAHWSLTNGGAGGACQPTRNDDVIFNANSFSVASGGTDLRIDVAQAECKSMTWSGSMPAGLTIDNNGGPNDQLSIYGSLKLKGTSNWNYTGTVAFRSATTGNTIDLNGKELRAVVFNGAGSWSFLSAVKCYTMDLQAGHVYTMNKALRCMTLNSNTNTIRSLRAGTSTVTCRDLNTNGTNMLLDGDSATFRVQNFMSQVTATFHDVRMDFNTEYPDGIHYLRLFCSNASIDTLIANEWVSLSTFNTTVGFGLFRGDVTNNSTVTFGTINAKHDFFNLGPLYVDSLILSTGDQTLSMSTAIYANHLITSGNCRNYTTIRNYYPNVTPMISIPSGTVNCSYLILANIDATGGATFNAYNSLVVSNVTGWNIISSPSPQTMYWVNGTGN